MKNDKRSAERERSPLMSGTAEPDTGNSFINKFIKKRRKLLNQFPKGYKVASNEGEMQMLKAVDGVPHATFAMASPGAPSARPQHFLLPFQARFFELSRQLGTRREGVFDLFQKVAMPFSALLLSFLRTRRA